MPTFTYPGVTGVITFSGTSSVGISPAIIGMTVFPDSVPELHGDLVIGDDINPNIPIPDCFLQYKEEVTSAGDRSIVMRLLDRRWRWMQPGAYPIPDDGHYNQQDGNRKLIPWSILSPYQIARLCLAALGEIPIDAPYAPGLIDLPGGLARAAVTGIIPPYGPDDKLVDVYEDYLRLGQNLAETKTNPTVVWQSSPAAPALASFVEQYGRAVALNYFDNTVRVVKLGTGTALPAGGIHESTGASVTGEPIPTLITAVGSATRYQPRVFCRPVGKDGDGNYYPHERLSHAPERAGQKMKVQVEGGAYSALTAYGVKINGNVFTIAPGAQPTIDDVITDLATQINAFGAFAGVLGASTDVTPPRLYVEAVVDGYEFEFFADASAGTTAFIADWFPTCLVGPITGVRDTQPVIRLSFSAAGYVASSTVLDLTINGTTVSVGPQDTDLADALSDLAFLANGDGVIGPAASSAAGAESVTVTGNVAGVAITATGASSDGSVVATELAGTTFTPRGYEKGWGSYGWLAQAVAGDAAKGIVSLSYTQAKALADESIYRDYQVMTVDPADPNTHTIPVPGYGSVDNRFRLVLQGSRPETVLPRPGEAAVLDPKTGQPFAIDTYNGYSVDRPNQAFGGAFIGVILGSGIGWYRGTYFNNTLPKALLPIPFTIIDAEKQIIRFSQPVYRILGKDGGFASCASDIVIEVGALVLEPTLAPARYSFTKATGGFGPEVTRVFPDIQQEVISEYNADHTVAGSHVLDADAENRAIYYTDSMASVLQLPNGTTRKYAGLLSIPIDGLVRQVSWSFSAGSGPETTCSENTEFSKVIVPYQTRRRSENMPPDSTRSMENLLTDYRIRGALRAAVSIIPGASGP